MRALLILLAFQGAAPPAAPQVTARIVPDTVTIGQAFTIELRVRAATGSEIRFPALPDSSDVVEPLDPRLVRDASKAGVLDRTAVYRLIAWDTGQRVVRFGEIAVTRDGASTRYSVSLPPVTVRSVLPADTSQREPRPARGMLVIDGSWWRLWLALAVVLGLAFWSWRVWRRREVSEMDPGPDAAEVAALGFEHAGRIGLLEAGETGRYVLTHVHVMREYLAARFPLSGPAQTAREASAALAGAELPILPARVTDLLLTSEQLAFARAPVADAEARLMAEEARSIVRDIETVWRARKESATRSTKRRRR